MITTHEIFYDQENNITYYMEYNELGTPFKLGWFHDSGYDFEEFKNSKCNSDQAMVENYKMFKVMSSYLGGDSFHQKLASFVSIITLLQTSEYQISNINYKNYKL